MSSVIGPSLRPAAYSGLFGLAVFALCLAGILSREHLDLATIWPANAFVLGMLARFPVLDRPASWFYGGAAFLLADALTGAPPLTNLILNGANFVGIVTGYLLISRLPDRDRRLRGPSSILYVFRVILCASAATGVAGMIANPVIFGRSPIEGFIFWAVSEVTNYSTFLPLLLAIPIAKTPRLAALAAWFAAPIEASRALPAAALLTCCFLSVLVGGPGAFAIPIPALLWCAVTYTLFTTTILAFAFGAWTLLALRIGLLPLAETSPTRALVISARVGVTMLALAPVAVACVMEARNDLLERLRFLADRDAMTGLHNRRSFLETAMRVLRRAACGGGPIAVMLIDVDHFKAINDSHGHDAGDRVLVAVAATLARHVRPADTVGRIGGEEFAIILPDCGPEAALSVAERIAGELRATTITSCDGALISATASIGIHVDQEGQAIEQLLTSADKAMYIAKRAGRDRIALSPSALAFVRAATAVRPAPAPSAA